MIRLSKKLSSLLYSYKGFENFFYRAHKILKNWTDGIDWQIG